MHALARLDRIRQRIRAGLPLVPEDAVLLGGALELAMDGQCSIEAGLGLSKGWKKDYLIHRRLKAFRAMAGTIKLGQRTEFAGQLHHALSVYAMGQFRFDKLPGRGPSARHVLHYEILCSTGGKVPSVNTLIAWLSEADCVSDAA